MTTSAIVLIVASRWVAPPSAQPGPRDLDEVDREHRDHDRGLHRRRGPVVHGPGPELRAVETQAGEQGGSRHEGGRWERLGGLDNRIPRDILPCTPARNEAFMSVVKVLTLATTAVLGLVSVTAAQDTTAAAPTPVARVVLATPRTTVVVNDSVRLQARALDANGRPLPEAKIVFKSVGPAQAQVEEDGLVRAGSVGDVPLIATAIVPGTKPYIEHLSVRVVPGPGEKRPDRRRAGAAGAAPAHAARRGRALRRGRRPGRRGRLVQLGAVRRTGESRWPARGPCRRPGDGPRVVRRDCAPSCRSRSWPPRRRRSRSSRRRPRCVRATSFASPPPPAAPPIARSRDSRPHGRSVRARATSTTTARSSPTSRAPTPSRRPWAAAPPRPR